ncbi:tRNA 2-thiouridine(34) synthase MnmA [Porphyromonas crevioricanis]|uniref:tRNA 2-thiouridine(34) synthase MnmA n=1 Tax=Porphyromonas crevioricanis TaxID=393921 RepID=UPI000691EEE5|nr:tRNA 2-thiouridine(34) synthase MnmA [Porphyromonas crevioricanis]
MTDLQEILARHQGRVPSVAALVSGGVDSSVVVHRLVEAGFKPHIFYIRIGMQDEDGFVDCPAEEDIELTTLLARKYGLPMDVVSLHQEYWEKVVSYTIDTVKRGLTPNPDVMCNKLIKFGCFEEKWGHHFDYIATGHYATTTYIDDCCYLSTAKDPIKDQTDFLAQINFAQVSKLLFPIGHLMKSEVRDIAEAARIPSAKRRDSQGICFLGKVNYNDFIRRYLGEKPGRIIDRETGKTIGTHRGYWFHTIGQRKGLGLSGGPWFVVKKDTKRNIILVSRGYDPADQYGREIDMAQFDFISGSANLWPDFSIQQLRQGIFSSLAPVCISFKIRHTPEFIGGTLSPLGDHGFRIKSDEPVQGIAPGQYGVVYDLDHRLCLGSGMITAGG